MLIEELTSLQTDAGVTLHAYVITRTKTHPSFNEGVAQELCTTADKQGWTYLPLILHTGVSGDTRVLREIMLRDKKATAKMQKALDGREDSFFAIFVLPTSSDDNKKLMELH